MTQQTPFRLLIVEDSPDHAELIRRSLERVGADVELQHVSDGAEALDYLFHQGAYADAEANPRPDLLLLDLSLPKVPGLAVLRTSKEDVRTASIPIVVLTSSDADRDVQAAYEARANSYLVKPMSFSDLKTMMAALTDYWVHHNIPVPAA